MILGQYQRKTHLPHLFHALNTCHIMNFEKKNIIGMNNAFFLLVVKLTERHMVVYQEWRMYHCTYIFLTADVPAYLIKLLLINILLLC